MVSYNTFLKKVIIVSSKHSVPATWHPPFNCLIVHGLHHDIKQITNITIFMNMERKNGLKGMQSFCLKTRDVVELGSGHWTAHPPEFEQVDKKRFWKDQRRRGHSGLSCQEA